MFDHVVFGVSDYAASKALFHKALEPLGVAVVLEGPLGVELSPKGKYIIVHVPNRGEAGASALGGSAAEMMAPSKYEALAICAGCW